MTKPEESIDLVDFSHVLDNPTDFNEEKMADMTHGLL